MTGLNMPRTPVTGATMKSVVGFLVFCELASGFTQGYYAPLLPELARSLSVSDADIT
jgi:hypothetical protein